MGPDPIHSCRRRSRWIVHHGCESHRLRDLATKKGPSDWMGLFPDGSLALTCFRVRKRHAIIAATRVRSADESFAPRFEAYFHCSGVRRIVRDSQRAFANAAKARHVSGRRPAAAADKRSKKGRLASFYATFPVEYANQL